MYQGSSFGPSLVFDQLVMGFELTEPEERKRYWEESERRDINQLEF